MRIVSYKYLFVVLVLAIGVAAVQVTLSVARLLSEPLPYPDAKKLFTVNGAASPVTGGRLEWWSQRVQGCMLSSMAVEDDEVIMRERGRILKVVTVSSSFFDVLKVSPLHGRVDGSSLTDKPSVIISEHLWRNSYADADPLGQIIRIGSSYYVVAGVLRDGDALPLNADLWVIPTTGEHISGGDAAVIIGRVNSDANFSIVRQQFDRAYFQLKYELSLSNINSGSPVSLSQLSDLQIGKSYLVYRSFLFASLIILLGAMASASSVMIVASLKKQQTQAVRLSLGEPRSSIIRRALLESVVVGVASFGVSVVIFICLQKWLKLHMAAQAPLLGRFHADYVAMGLGATACMVVSVVCNVVPHFQVLARGVSLRKMLERGSSGLSMSMGVYNVIAAMEIACAVALSFGVLITVRELRRVSSGELGFEINDISYVNVRQPMQDGWGKDGLRLYLDGTTRELISNRAVKRVSWISQMPFSGVSPSYVYLDKDSQPRGEAMPVYVDKAYFDNMHIKFLSRYNNLFLGDRPDGVVVNESLASMLGIVGGANGQHVRIEGESEDRVVVGIVADTKFRSIGEKSEMQLYMPFASAYMGRVPSKFYVVIEGSGVTDAIVGCALKKYNQKTAIGELKSLGSQISDSALLYRIRVQIYIVITFLSSILVFVGVVACMQQLALLRANEVAIRVAFGGTRNAIAKLYFMTMFKCSTAGVCVGTVLCVLARKMVVYTVEDSFELIKEIFCVMIVVYVVALLISSIYASICARKDVMKCLREVR